jgi:hypothetical protein
MKLIFLVCLVTAPDVCREEQLNYSFEPIAATTCMAGAQPRLAEWTEAHPGWRIARWRCNAARAEGYRT